MTRPFRPEFPGARYHVTSRGERREGVFLSDDDRHDWLNVLGATCHLPPASASASASASVSVSVSGSTAWCVRPVR